MTDHGANVPPVLQSLEVRQVDECSVQLRICTDDDAASLLWAVQWLDEHREFFIESLRFDPPPGAEEDDDHVVRMLVIELHRAFERSGRRFGPWPQGVPPLYV